MLRTAALIALLAIPTARLAADDAADKALKDLQGEWKLEKMTHGGEDAPADLVAKMSFTIKDSTIVPSDNPKDVATIKLDPSKKPAHIDLTGKGKTEKTMPGIYELSGDTQKMCFGDEGGDRPMEFKSAKGSKTFVMVLKKATK
jgi:uncharacterized protein (TIGR03067 family)